MNRKQNPTLGMFIIAVIIGALPFGIVGTMKWFVGLNFEREVVGKLKQVADSNNIELASKKLNEVVSHLDQNNLKSGSTHVFFATPEHDVSFFYDNLSNALNDLKNFPPPSGDLAQYNLSMSNQLIKLRETILDGDQRVTCPPNFAFFPNQVAWALFGAMSIGWGVLTFLFVAIKYDWS